VRSLLKPSFKNFSNLLIAFMLAVAVWSMAVTTADPVERRSYPRPIPIEVVGLSSTRFKAEPSADYITLILSAPQSVWTKLIANPDLIRAYVDLNDLNLKERQIPVRVEIALQPVKVEDITPAGVRVTIQFQENLNQEPE